MVFLALEVAVDHVAEDRSAAAVPYNLDATADAVPPGLQGGAVGIELDVAVDVAAENRRAAALLDLNAAADSRRLLHDDAAVVLRLDVADDPDTIRRQAGIALNLDCALDCRAVESAVGVFRYPQVVHGYCAEGAGTHPLAG